MVYCLQKQSERPAADDPVLRGRHSRPVKLLLSNYLTATTAVMMDPSSIYTQDETECGDDGDSDNSDKHGRLLRLRCAPRCDSEWHHDILELHTPSRSN